MASSDEVQRIVDELSRLLGAPATLESRDFRLIAFCAHDAADGADIDSVRMRSILSRGSTPETRTWFEGFQIATARAAVRTPSEPERGIMSRLCLPVRHRRRLMGYVWLLDGGRIDPTSPEVADAMLLAARIGEVLTARAGGEWGDALIAALTSSGARRNEGLRVLAGQLAGSAATVVVGGPSQLSAVIDGASVLLVPLAAITDDRPALTAAGAGPAGVGAPFVDIGELRECYRQAAFAARVAQVVPAVGPVARWADLGPYRLLRDIRRADSLIEKVIDQLTEGPNLLETAEVFLDLAGNVTQAAAALHIHRQTLYYRLARIEELTGLDLASGEDRLMLHMSIKVLRLAG